MRAKHEVKLNMDITAYVIANADDDAVDLLSSTVESILKNVLSPGIEIDSVDLQSSEATEI